MTYTRAIGISCNKVILLIVRGLALSKIHPNVLTFLGLVINIGAAALLVVGQFRWACVVIIGAGLFDMVDGCVARGHIALQNSLGLPFLERLRDRIVGVRLLAQIQPDEIIRRFLIQSLLFVLGDNVVRRRDDFR